MTHGVYRTRNEESGACHVHVEYVNYKTMDLPEQRYRYRGYQPTFDELPWKNDYDTAKADAESQKCKRPPTGGLLHDCCIKSALIGRSIHLLHRETSYTRLVFVQLNALGVGRT